MYHYISNLYVTKFVHVLFPRLIWCLASIQWEDPSVRSNGFHFLPQCQVGAAVTKKLEQKWRKSVLAWWGNSNFWRMVLMPGKIISRRIGRLSDLHFVSLKHFSKFKRNLWISQEVVFSQCGGIVLVLVFLVEWNIFIHWKMRNLPKGFSHWRYA